MPRMASPHRSGRWRPRLAVAAALLAGVSQVRAADSDAELAKKLSNPVANLISVPLQFNYDCCYGPDDGSRETLNVQPVIPVSLTRDWNVIIRTILPVIHQQRTSPTAGPAWGLGDTTQSFFFSPKTTHNGLVWAIGPAFLWPTGDSRLGSKKWGAGPTALVLKQQHGWTYGVLANHIWSYANAGDPHRPGVSSTFVQPFLSYTTAKHTTYGLNTESSYNWKTRRWTVPINATIAQLYNFGGQRVQLTAGVRAVTAHEEGGAEWGLRFAATFLFPQ
jgi:hypothetical protein